MSARPSAAEQLRIPEVARCEELALSLRRFVCHAEPYGVECVGQTAASEWRKLLPRPVELTWMAPAELERILDEWERCFTEVHRPARRLRIELDGIEATRKGKGGRFTVGKRRRRSRAETAVAAQLLVDDGLTRLEIAEKLGVQVKTVDNLLSPGALRATDSLRNAVRGIKPPANEGVEKGGLGPSGRGSTMRFAAEAESA